MGYTLANVLCRYGTGSGIEQGRVWLQGRRAGVFYERGFLRFFFAFTENGHVLLPQVARDLGTL
jgi:hypothetical protein